MHRMTTNTPASAQRGKRPLLKRSDVALLAQLSECQVARLSKSGRMPAPVIARHKFVRYDADQIDAWMAGEWVPAQQLQHGPK